MLTQRFLKEQLFPIALSGVVCMVLIGVLLFEIEVLNSHTQGALIFPKLRIVDFFIGLTVYLKTSVDFAIFIGNLMHSNEGWKSRVSIEIGTALGNALGTMAIILFWAVFKDVEWVLALMIIFAALVLFKLAEEGLEHAKETDRTYPSFFRFFVRTLELVLDRTNKVIAPVLKYTVPNISMRPSPRSGFWKLLRYSFFVPFVLGLDDFAGYIPLFSVTNVFGFSVGVFVAHALLTMLLYISPRRTVSFVKNPIISVLGSVAFLLLAVYGIMEAIHIVFF
jgi:hypothetical protein